MATTEKPKETKRRVTLTPIYVDLETAAALTTLSESTIEALEREDKFPKRRQISGRRTGYLLREIEEWGENCPVSSLPPPPNTGAKKPRTATEQPEPQGDRKAA